MKTMDMNELSQMTYQFDRAESRDVFVGDSRNAEKDYKAVFNIDKQKVACICSDGYNIVQHRHLVDSVREAIGNLNIKATATVRDDGNRIFVDINFPDSKLYVAKGEEFFSGIRLINSYNKTTGIMMLPHLVRLACSNGMVVDVNWVKSFNVSHTSKLAKEFEVSVAVMIKDMVEGNEKFKAMVNGCIGDSIEWEIMDSIINKLVDARSKHIEAIKSQLKVECNGKIPSRWNLYNSFTSYATHGQQLSPNINHWLQTKAQKVLVTPLVELKPKQIISA